MSNAKGWGMRHRLVFVTAVVMSNAVMHIRGGRRMIGQQGAFERLLSYEVRWHYSTIESEIRIYEGVRIPPPGASPLNTHTAPRGFLPSPPFCTDALSTSARTAFGVLLLCASCVACFWYGRCAACCSRYGCS